MRGQVRASRTLLERPHQPICLLFAGSEWLHSHRHMWRLLVRYRLGGRCLEVRELTEPPSCRFCGNRTARSMCLTCPDRPALHHPRTTNGQAPNVEWPCSRLYHDQSFEAKWCHSDSKGASAEFNAHPQVTALGKKQAVRNKPNKSKAASPYIFAPKR